MNIFPLYSDCAWSYQFPDTNVREELKNTPIAGGIKSVFLWISQYFDSFPHRYGAIFALFSPRGGNDRQIFLYFLQRLIETFTSSVRHIGDTLSNESKRNFICFPAPEAGGDTNRGILIHSFEQIHKILCIHKKIFNIKARVV